MQTTFASGQGDRIAETDFRETQHFKLYQSFTVDPAGFVADAIRDGD